LRDFEPAYDRCGSNPDLRVFPLHVRLGAASGIPSGTVRCRSRADRETLRAPFKIRRGGYSFVRELSAGLAEILCFQFSGTAHAIGRLTPWPAALASE
jgi:hypothetical protein